MPPSEPRETEPPPSSQGKKRSESRQSPLKQSRKKGSSKAPSPLPGVILEDEEEKLAQTYMYMYLQNGFVRICNLNISFVLQRKRNKEGREEAK